MLKNIALSIVMPMYNCEKYVKKAVISCLSQSFCCEIIIIDDGSTDSSASIVSELANSNYQIRVVSQENRGLSAARNKGASLARGQYLYFIDSDDWIEQDTLGDMVELMHETSADMGFFHGNVQDYHQGKVYAFYDWWVWDSLGERNFITPQDSNFHLLYELEPQVGIKIFCRDFYAKNQLKFRTGVQFEDLFVHVKSIKQSTKIALHRKNIFNYRLGRPGQITSGISKKRLDALIAYEDSLKFLLNSSVNVDDKEGAAVVRAAFRLITWCARFVPPENIAEFNIKAIELVGKTPASWVANVLSGKDPSAQRRAYLLALKRGDSRTANQYALSGKFGYRNFPSLVNEVGLKNACRITLRSTS